MALILHQKLFQSDFKAISLHPKALVLTLKVLLHPGKVSLLVVNQRDLLFFKSLSHRVFRAQLFLQLLLPHLLFSQLRSKLFDFKFKLALTISRVNQLLCHLLHGPLEGL